MTMQTPPPSGAEQFQALIYRIRDSKWVRLLRTYQTLVLAIACVLFAALLGLVTQPRTMVTPTQTVPTEMAINGSITPLTVAEASTQPTQAGLSTPDTFEATPTIGEIGPLPPGRATAEIGFPTEEGATPYPLPGQIEPTGVGDQPTIGPFPTIPGGESIFPTFAPPESNTGASRPTATSDQGNDPYPGPGDETPFVPPTNIPVPTDDPNTGFPTDEPIPTDDPNNGFPTSAPEESTMIPTDSLPPTDAPPTSTPTPTVPPFDVLGNNTRWTAAQSPVILRRDTVLRNGSTLTIEDGVEVQMAPDVSLTIDGVMNARGVRFRKQGAGNWQSLVVTANGRATLSGVDVRGGGSKGVVVAALGGSTVIEDSRFEDNKGKILVDGGNLDMQRSSVVGYAPINAHVVSGGKLRLISNAINNTATDGATGITLSAASPDVTINVEKNAIRASSGTNLRAQLDQSLDATFTCNTFSGGAVGLQIKSTDPTLDGSRIIINGNNFLTHKNYGAAGDVGLDVRNNWWGDPSGPYHPQQNGAGTGDAVGTNLTFSPWLNTRSSCAP